MRQIPISNHVKLSGSFLLNVCLLYCIYNDRYNGILKATCTLEHSLQIIEIAEHFSTLWRKSLHRKLTLSRIVTRKVSLLTVMN